MNCNNINFSILEPQPGDSAETFHLKGLLYSSLEREQELAHTVAAQREELAHLHRLLSQAHRPEPCEVEVLDGDMRNMTIGSQWRR